MQVIWQRPLLDLIWNRPTLNVEHVPELAILILYTVALMYSVNQDIMGDYSSVGSVMSTQGNTVKVPGNMAVQCPCLLALSSNGRADFSSNPVLPFA